MKILTVNCVYEIYSTGKIIKNIAEFLADRDCEFFYCYEFGEKAGASNAFRISGRYEYYFYYLWSRMIGLPYGTGYLSTMRLIRKMKKVSPDIVHIHCPNANAVNLYWLLNYLKRKQIPTIITNHAEYFYTGNCAHAFECRGYLNGCKECKEYKLQTSSWFFNRTGYAWKRMKKAFDGFERLMMVAVSPWQEQRIRTSSIAKECETVVVKNGIDTENIFYYRKNVGLDIKSTGEKILLHVTAHFSDNPDDPKGGRYVIKLAEALPDIRIIVVGPYDLELKQVPANMELAGAVGDPSVLAQYYSAADLLVMASRRETYGLTCAESLSCGTPVVGFKNGGTETIALPEYSCFVDYGDVDALADTVKLWIERKESICRELEQKAKEVYSNRNMAMEYNKLYNQVLEKR